jgi:ubiquinone/menaquinone biosynthesis C-methylase UbiE
MTKIEREVSVNDEMARIMLVERYGDAYGEHVAERVELLLALDGYIDRFDYLKSILGQNMHKLFSRIMISGYAAGSEMVVARRFGFQEIHGVEVDSSLLEVTQKRLSGLPGIFPALYDGLYLPYNDEQFDMVISGHIIEHTQSPKIYLNEVMRILRPGGILYIEFPSRYHHTELHTGLFSFEWLPVFLRNLVLRIISSKISFLDTQTKAKYRVILTTGLKQVSRRDIFLLLRQLRVSYKEIAFSKPSPGIIRSLIRKEE